MAVTPTTPRRLAWASFTFSIAMLLAGILATVLIRADGVVSSVLLMLILMGFPVAGILIARRQPHNRIAWILLAIGAFGGLAAVAEPYAQYGIVTHPGSLPAAGVVAAVNQCLWVTVLGPIGTYLILLFPDGRLPSRRWRPVAWAAGITMGLLIPLLVFAPGELDAGSNIRNPIGIDVLASPIDVLLIVLPAFPLSILACAVALVVRFRRSAGVERLQLKWLATAGATVALAYLGLTLVTVISKLADPGRTTDPTWLAVLQTATVMLFGLIPAAIGVAVLKHGLYGIDVVINKALVFGALGAFITGVYVAIVVGVGTLVGQGNNSLALSIAATAVVAIAFQPVRERVQHLANRLVYGQRATPYEVLSDFANRMGGTYGSAELLPKMARTVAEGTGAARVDVWLNIESELTLEASWPEPDTDAPTPLPMSGDELPELAGDRVAPVRHHGEILGAITVRKAPGEPITPTEDKLLADVAAQAGLVLRNVRLIEELRGSRERLVKTSDTERRRLERNLHDGAQQSLVSVAVMLRIAQRRVGDDDADGIAPALGQAAEQLSTAIDELRELARGIHPALLTERGLGPALTSLGERSRVPTHATISLTDRLSPTIEGTVYFFAAESLANVAKYAQATSVTVTVEHAGGEIVATVTDDGVGGADPAKGSGLTGLSDRIAAVDGRLDIHSPPGAGTRLVCRIPVATQPPLVTDEQAPEVKNHVLAGGGR